MIAKMKKIEIMMMNYYFVSTRSFSLLFSHILFLLVPLHHKKGSSYRKNIIIIKV